MLLDILIKDEKKNDNKLYSSGPYWKYKNKKTISEIKKEGLKDFRGISSGIGTSFTDNLVLDIGNELNFRGRLVRKIFSLPVLRIIFKLQIRLTKNYMEDYLKNKSLVFKKDKNVLDLIRKYKFENTTDFGCVEKFNILDKEYSFRYLEMADRVNKLSNYFDFNKIKSYFEIGGGFGANIHFILTNFPNIKKIIYLDTVPNIYVGTEYLKHHYKDNVIDYLKVKNFSEISFSNNDNLEIICIPPWLIEKLNVKIDHFHNAASFVEMPKNIISNYVKFIKKFKTKEISLISYDDYDSKTTFNPEELNIFFEKKLKINRQNNIIEDYNKKLIYLTSN